MFSNDCLLELLVKFLCVSFFLLFTWCKQANHQARKFPGHILTGMKLTGKYTGNWHDSAKKLANKLKEVKY